MRFMRFTPLLILLAGCSRPQETLVYDQTANFVFSGPLIEGSNTAAVEISHRLDSFLQANNVQADRVKSVKLEAASISLPDTATFDLSQSATLSMAGNTEKMQTVGVVNPVEKGKSILQFKCSDEKELNAYFKEKQFSLVCDLNLTEDHDYDIRTAGLFRFTISYRK
jgi:hypothetical protein